MQSLRAAQQTGGGTMNTRMTGMRALPMLPLLALAGMVACTDTTGTGSLDKLNETALADYKAMDDLQQSSGWKNFRLTAAGMRAVGEASTSSAQFNLIPGGSRAGIRLVSDTNLGKTFVYDAQDHRWEVDPSRTDAPANGVRFITYEPNGEEPDPTKPTGHADLIDTGSGIAGVALRLVVVEGTLTVLDYQTSISGSNGIAHVTVDGFLQDKQQKLDFEIDARWQNSNGTEHGSVAFDLGIASRSFHVEGDVNSVKANGAEHTTVDLSTRHGSQAFRVDVANDLGDLSGVINLNDNPFANVAGRDGAPVFTTPSGGALSASEGLVLWRIFDVTEDVFDLLEDLVDPIDDLLLIGIVL
jgi:hypothetical protein